MNCFPSHPTANFEGQLKNGERYDSVIDPDTDLASDKALYRPMTNTDSEDMILGIQRVMSFLTFLCYSIESTYQQKIQYNWQMQLKSQRTPLSGRMCLTSPAEQLRLQTWISNKTLNEHRQ